MKNIHTQYDQEMPIDPTFHLMQSKKAHRWEAFQPPEYWEYRRKWEDYPRTHTVSHFPIHLDIESTNYCNLDCPMCPRTEMLNDGTFRKNMMIDFGLYTRIIDEGRQAGLCSVKYNFLGEPTMHPRLVEMIEYARDAGILDIMFNTNATLLDEDLSRRLIASGLNQIFFSFDSPFREKYNRIRVGADYDKVLANIKRFVELRNRMGSLKPLTRASMTLMKDNENEWDAFRELFEPIVDVVAYGEYVNHVGTNKTQGAQQAQCGIVKRNPQFCCTQLWNRMFILSNGTALVCCIDMKVGMQVGNVNEQSVKDIWLGEKYQQLRKLHAAGCFEEIPLCAKCPLQFYFSSRPCDNHAPRDNL